MKLSGLRIPILSTCFLLWALAPAFTQTFQESEQAFHERMKWWNEGRLGMFLHWGVYSTFEGEYGGMDHGKEMGGASAEWIYLKAHIPQEEYREAARRFNPVDFNAEQWVKMAKEAGMKYMVLTSKHHDGYALFDTRASDWNVVQTSSIRRDLIREYVDACHRHEMRVGFYYSHEKDWFNHARISRDRGPLSKDYKEYVRIQIRELFRNYGQIDLIWFDTPIAEHEEFNRECAMLVRELQPNCIINGRIGNNLGDYRNIGDRAIVDPGLAGYMESIMTMRLNWGFDRNDDFWKSSEDLISMVSKSACRGSNFLLNIGPTPSGTFPPEDRVRLRDLGDWMKKNGEAIYATSGSPFAKEHPWGSITLKKDPGSVYLHLWNWTGGDIEVSGLLSGVNNARFLDNGENVPFNSSPGNGALVVHLPESRSSEFHRIIRLELGGAPEFDLNSGPDFSPPKVDHVTRHRILGKITPLKSTQFSITGKKLVSSDRDYSIPDNKETTLQLSLNDHVRYRINEGGTIYQVQGFELSKQKVYDVVYSPYSRGPVVEIITEIRNTSE